MYVVVVYFFTGLPQGTPSYKVVPVISGHCQLFTLFNPEGVACFDKPCIPFENFAHKFNSLRSWRFQFGERANEL